LRCRVKLPSVRSMRNVPLTWKTRAALAALASADYPYRSAMLVNLANALGTRHRLHGDIADLEESVSLHRAAVAEEGPDGINRAGFLANLSLSLRDLYLARGRREDLEEAVSHGRLAVELSPEAEPRIATRLGNLATTLLHRYRATDDPADLDESISLSARGRWSPVSAGAAIPATWKERLVICARRWPRSLLTIQVIHGTLTTWPTRWPSNSSSPGSPKISTMR